LRALRTAQPGLTLVGMDFDRGACAHAERKSGCPIAADRSHAHDHSHHPAR